MISFTQLQEEWTKDLEALIKKSLELHKNGESFLANRYDGRIEELGNCIKELTEVMRKKL